MPSEQQLSSVLCEFARTMGTDFPIQAILDHLVKRIVDVLPITAAGVTLIEPDSDPRYVAASDESALRFEELQTELGEGPCLAAYQTGHAVAIADLRDDSRFPSFAPRALEAGLVAVFTFPLRSGEEELGALDLYRDSPGPLDATAMKAAQTLADVAAAYLLNAQARADLQDSAERTARLAAIVESSNDSIISWTAGGIITSWNSGSERMYGYRADEAIGQDLSLIVPPPRMAKIGSIHEEMIRGGTPFPLETQRVRSDGTLVDVAVMISPIRDRTGTIVGLSDVGRDITENNRAAEALRDSEARKGAILASALDAIITMDHEGRIDEFNPAAERTFGYTSADVLGRSLAEVILPPADRAHLQLGLDYTATGDGPLSGRRTQLTAVRADGTVFPAEVSINRVDTPGPPLFTGFIRDITDQKAAEAQGKSLEDRLHQSQRLASLGELAGGVAHDFNNLLAVILNYTSFVAEAIPDHLEVQSDVEQILSATERAVRLTQQLLMFARREPMHPELLDLNAVVDDIHALLSRSIGAQVDLVVHAETNLPAIRADRGQTEQILLNLAVNARDAMPDGGTLTIETQAVDLDGDYARLHPPTKPGRYVQLSVSDTGVGMSRAVAARAFDPFFTTKSKTEGSGLGLATVYGIISEAGGVVNLYSEEGLGTTVRAYLPATTDRVATPTAGPPTPALRGNGETVLVVEDQEAMRDLTVRILRRNGYLVLQAASGVDAISISAEQPIDLLLTDVVMPKMSGRRLAEHLRAQDPAMPVLYMSGYAQGVLGPQRALEDDVALIQKPFNATALLHSVHQTITAGVGGRSDPTELIRHGPKL